MRLTLRTLLAYLDDVLEPADTKIIGQKIQESPMAQLLVSRIREVMRRRRLKAPDVSGPEMGIDPNIVSQYLDTTLPPDQYADVERVLLASDEMLAEVAACHQVLPVWLANPVEVSDERRESLYALGPVDSSSQLAVPGEKGIVARSKTPESIPIRNGIASNPRRGASSTTGPAGAETSVPDYLKPSPWPIRLLPTAIVGLLVLLCIGLLGPGLLSGVRQANNEIKRKVIRDQIETTDSHDAVESPSEAHGPAGAVAQSTTTEEGAVHDVDMVSAAPPQSPAGAAKAAGRPKLPDGLDPEPPEDVAEVDIVPAPQPVAPQVDATTTDKVASKEPSVEGAAPPEGEVNRKRKFATTDGSVPDLAITYSSKEGVLARLDEERRHWLMVPHRSAMKPGEILANVEPFESVLEFDKGNVRATLIGEGAVYLIDPSQAGIVGIGVRKGRMMIQNGRQEKDHSASLGIALGNDLWKLDFLVADTVCGLEVIPRESTQFQQVHGEHWYQATLYVISGKAKWISLSGESQEIAQGQALNIVPEKDLQIRSSPIPIHTAPDWCDSTKRKALPIRRYQSQIQFEKMFELNQPIEESMLTLVKNSKSPKISELAAQCLAAIENYAALVETLAESPFEEARFVARDGLRQWLPMHPDNGQKLMTELEMYYPPAEAEAVNSMLWGFSPEDVTNSRTKSWQFVNWMRSPKPEIRELADYWVERLQGRKTEYRALGGTAVQRETQLHRLEELIEKNNGLIRAE